MRINVATPDRLARTIIGAILIVLPLVSGLGLFADPLWLWASVALGAVLMLTALVRICPLYAVLGLSTCKVL